MLELNATRLVRMQKLRDKALNITAATLRKFYSLLESSLRDHRCKTREEMLGLLKKEKVDVHDNRASHLFFHAEQAGILCNGPIVENKQTLALLAERVPVTQKIDAEEARSLLAARYFKSHGPATLADFAWWSGSTITQAGKALESVQDIPDSTSISGQMYWWYGSVTANARKTSGIFVLPACDEYIIRYKNRIASLLPSDHARAISTNGIFRPIIVVNGQIVGLWKRTVLRGKLTVETGFFRGEKGYKPSEVNRAAKKLGHFL